MFYGGGPLIATPYELDALKMEIHMQKEWRESDNY